MPVQRIIAAFEKLKDIHEQLHVLANQKRDAIVRNSVEEVSGIVSKEKKLVRDIEEQLREQADATNQFFRNKGFTPTRVINVTELSKMITDLEDKEALAAARDRLADVVAGLKEKNELNQQLIAQSLAFINYSFELIAGPDEEPVYRNPNENRYSASRGAGYFDSRA